MRDTYSGHHLLEFALDLGGWFSCYKEFNGGEMEQPAADVFVTPVGHFSPGKLSNIKKDALQYSLYDSRTSVADLRVTVNHVAQSTKEFR